MTNKPKTDEAKIEYVVDALVNNDYRPGYVMSGWVGDVFVYAVSDTKSLFAYKADDLIAAYDHGFAEAMTLFDTEAEDVVLDNFDEVVASTAHGYLENRDQVTDNYDLRKEAS